LGAAVLNWTWLYMSLEIAIFLAFSAAMWHVIKHADRESVADHAKRLAPPRATAAPDAEGSAARQLEVAGR
jgi:hypothetical protein